MSDPAASSDTWEGGEEASVAFDELLDRHYKKIYNLLLRMTGDFDEAAELTQDVFVQAYRALPTFRGEAKIYTWLYRIAVNRCKNRMKQISRSSQVISGSLDDPLEADEGLTREVPDQRFTPERMLEQRELQQVVQDEIDRLSPDFRLVIVLRDIQGLTYREMADVIGISLEAVKSRLFRARCQLRERLRPYLAGAGRPGEDDPGPADRDRR